MKKRKKDNPFDLSDKQWDEVREEAKMEILRNKANAQSSQTTPVKKRPK